MKKILTTMLLAAIAWNSNAAPVTLNLLGTVTGADGNQSAGNVGSSVTTNVTIDLDPANTTYDPRPGNDPRWFLDIPPYGGQSIGYFGTIDATELFIEIFDDFDLDAFGNPFGVTGVADVLAIFGNNGNEEFIINLIDDSSWFSGNGVNDLPASIPDFSELTGVFGNTIFTDSNGDEIGRNDVTYQPLAVSAVPVPAAVWLFGTALIGLVGFSKRRKAA